MPVQDLPVIEIPLAGSLDQATGRLVRGPAILRLAENVTHDKDGELRKRRGYRLVDVSFETHRLDIEVLFVSVATLADELVIYGRDFMYSLHADEPVVDLASLTRRGPTMVGDADSYDVLAIGMTES